MNTVIHRFLLRVSCNLFWGISFRTSCFGFRDALIKAVTSSSSDMIFGYGKYPPEVVPKDFFGGKADVMDARPGPKTSDQKETYH